MTRQLLLIGAAGVVSAGLWLTGCGLLVSVGALLGVSAMFYFLLPTRVEIVNPAGKAVFITGQLYRQTDLMTKFLYSKSKMSQ